MITIKNKPVTTDVLIHEAITIANQDGFQELNLKKLAEALGIKTPSLYNHIEGLDNLKEELVIEGLKQLHETLQEAAVGLSGEEALKSMGIAYLAFARKNPGLYSATQLVNQWRSAMSNKRSDDILAIFRKVLTVYQLSDSEEIHVMRLFRSMMHGFALLEVNQGFGQPVNIDDSFLVSLDIVLAGIHKMYLS